MKVIALDIETKNLDMKAEGLDFNNPDGWKVSCVSIWHPTSGAYNYAGKDYFGSMAMSFEQLKDDLQTWFEDGYTLITKNGTNFDLPIISKSIADGGCGVKKIIKEYIEGDEIASRHLDLQTYLEVIHYCEEDARYTYEVWNVARTRGYIQASGKNSEGDYEECYVRISW